MRKILLWSLAFFIFFLFHSAFGSQFYETVFMPFKKNKFISLLYFFWFFSQFMFIGQIEAEASLLGMNPHGMDIHQALLSTTTRSNTITIFITSPAMFTPIDFMELKPKRKMQEERYIPTHLPGRSMVLLSLSVSLPGNTQRVLLFYIITTT